MMNIFNEFLYTGRLFEGDVLAVRWIDLVAVWVFGDKYLVPALQNSAMDMFIKKMHTRKCIPMRAIPAIWESTLASSPLRKLMLDILAYKPDIEAVLACGDRMQVWTEESLKDLVRAVHGRETTDGEYKFPRRGNCHYHIHNEGEKC
jgi:hypothetical protein